jgi:serine phosphatase RsbU (regulator of sigma subunit)
MPGDNFNAALPPTILSDQSTSGSRQFHWPLSAMRKEVFRKGDCLFKHGDKADRMFYLHRGAVRLPEIKKTITAGQVIGEFGLFSSRSERTASAICEEDLEAYSISRNEVLKFFKEDPSLAIEMIQLTFNRVLETERAEAEARERLESDLRIAREIQMSMLPQALPAAALKEQVALAAKMEPAREVGGDFYDYFMTGTNRLCVLIGDASGKGVPAALFVAVGKSLLKAEAGRGSRPHQIVSRVNRLLCEDNPLCMFITLLCLTIDTRTGEAECCNAGHERPLVCQTTGNIKRIELPVGRAIGVMSDARYSSGKFRLKPGETVVAYTDGVTEAINPQQECFSHQRLVQWLAARAPADVQQLLDALTNEVSAYRKSEPQSDDITLAAVKFLGRSAKPRKTAHVVASRRPSSRVGEAF